jgi:hypothetical protein
MAHVDPDIAVRAMTALWRSFGNEISGPLVGTWRSMCDALNLAAHTECSSSGWTALAMPTGIGKTQFAALYCALMPNPALDSYNYRTVALHPGVLFVTRFTAEADKFVEAVNQHAGCNIAAAYHQKSSTKLAHAANFPVLAITHVTCEHRQAHARIDTCGDNVWEQLIAWRQGQRAKIIIDETPNFVTPVQIETKDLTQTLGALSRLRDANRQLYAPIEQLVDATTDPQLGNRNRRITPCEFDCIRSIDTGLILQHLKSVDNDDIVLSHSSEKTSLRKTCKDTIEAIANLQRNGWGWVSLKPRTAQLNSATLHPSLQNGSGVILDATAGLYTGYRLLSPPAKIIAPAANVRNYDNVTLHLAWGHNVGKEYLVENADRLWLKQRSAIQSVLSANDRTLVCCHEEFKSKVCDHPANPERMAFEHWGNIEGRNDWDEYQAVALIGLFYLPAVVHLNAAQALLGPQTDDWLQNQEVRKSGTSQDLLVEMQREHLAATALQAIGRVQCRKVIDAAGRCKPTNVFLPLPSDTDGRAVLAAIVDAMPGIQIKDWQLDAGKRKPRTDQCCKRLIEFFTPVPAGNYTKAQVRSQAAIGPASLDRAIRRISKLASNEQKLLAELGVTYHPRYGRGAQSFFMKA